jgi:hypothetical protein
LSPDLDTSFVSAFPKELETIKTDNAEILRLIEQIKDALLLENQSRSNQLS